MEDGGADWELLAKNKNAKFKLEGRTTLKRLTMANAMAVINNVTYKVLTFWEKVPRQKEGALQEFFFFFFFSPHGQ